MGMLTVLMFIAGLVLTGMGDSLDRIGNSNRGFARDLISFHIINIFVL